LIVILIALLAVTVFAPPARPARAAAGDPFPPTVPQVFISQQRPTRLYRASTDGVGTWSVTQEGPTSAMHYNAIGYNPRDGYLYGFQGEQGPYQLGALIRIGEGGAITRVGSNFFGFGKVLNVGAVNPVNGYLYSMPSGAGYPNERTMSIVDMSTGTLVSTIQLTRAPLFSDMAFVGGFFWGVNEAVAGRLVRVDPTTGTTTMFDTGLFPIAPYGAAWTFGNGNLGLSNNFTGRVYQVAITDPASATPGFELVASSPGPASTQNDGAAVGGTTDLGIDKFGPADLDGSTVTYTLRVTNHGDTRSTGWVIDDPIPAQLRNLTTADARCTVSASSVRCVGGSLLVGESTDVVLQATVELAGAACVTNTARLRGYEDDPNSDNNASSTTACGHPEIDLEKTPDVTNAVLGDVVTYTFEATNMGNVQLAVTISDPLLGLSAISCPTPMPVVLAPTASVSCTANYTVTADDVAEGNITNVATAVGVDGAGRSVDSRGQAIVEVDERPSIELTKTTDVLAVDAAGDEVDYRLDAVNAGDVPLSGVEITDPMFDPEDLSCTPAAPAILEPGEHLVCTATLTVTGEHLEDGSITNEAMVSGRSPRGAAVNATARAVVVVVLVPEHPGIELTKDAGVDVVHHPGDVIHYTLTARNSGDVTLHDVAITDPLLTAAGLTCTPAAPATLAPNEQQVCTGRYTVTASDFMTGTVVNVATASGTSPLGDTVEATADELVTATLAPPHPSLTITKAADVSQYDEVGDIVRYTLTVANTGDIDLHDVTITDPLEGLSPLTCDSALPTSLQPSNTLTCQASYIITQHDLDSGQVHNTATATGRAPDDTEVHASDDATVTRAESKLPTTGFATGALPRWIATALMIGTALVILARRRRAQS
ncbi:MAG TPA: DUF11 domain-containing protein, partial [Ilumatobacteraceae bacterium]|nr:DUF11 domain-containing protein [Ilumatobacteraceae bacterium]